MKRYGPLYGFLLLAFLTSSGGAALAQHPVPGTDAAEAAQRAGAVTAADTNGPRSSPFNPPPENDRNFVTDAAPKLDTGCIFRSSGPIIFNLKITRHVGKLKSDGTLEKAAELVRAGLVSPRATLIMPAFDVDSDANVSGIQPERDRVTFNGQVLGFLQGRDNAWVLNTFEIPIEKVRFAERGAAGSAPSAALNEVRIDIDTANSQEAWCTSIDWGAQSFKAMSPIILIHGNNSEGEFFDRQGFTDELKDRHLLYDNSIDLPTDTVIANASRLNGLIPGIVESFGVDSVHVVVHSKGGLDTREYLATYQPGHDPDFKVLSYSSLSTPHNGSSGADVLMARENAAKVADKIEFVGFPAFTRQVAALLGVDAGTPDLTTWRTAAFNARNLIRLPRATVFNTTAADADQNRNGRIDRFFPDEFAGLRREDAKLRLMDSVPFAGPLAAREAVNFPYQILRHTAGVTVTYRQERTFFGGTRIVATITSVPNPSPLGNDVLVAIPSGQGVGSMALLTSNTATFTGSQGRDHATIANRGVAARVVQWIINAEKTRGDLR